MGGNLPDHSILGGKSSIRLLVNIKFPGGFLPYGRIPPGNFIERGI